jgi:hypothetical protein
MNERTAVEILRALPPIERVLFALEVEVELLRRNRVTR